jgi:hypothetical protein
MSEPHRMRRSATIGRLLAVAAASGFGLGTFVALSLVFAHIAAGSSLTWRIAIEDIMGVAWPTSIWLMALEGARSSWDVALVWGAALGSNGLLYAAVCCVLRVLLRIVRDR